MLKIRTTKHVIVFTVLVVVFAVLATVFEQLVLAQYFHPWITSVSIAVVAAIPIAYYTALKFKELNELYDERERLIHHDRLTEVLSREGFFTRIDMARRGPGVALMIDIDHFKSVNDTHGHLVGDRMLKHVAAIVSKELRDADLIARFGGEEFIVCLVDTGLDEGLIIAERLRGAVAESPLPLKKGALSATISIGVAVIAPDEEFEETVRRADSALYRAKNSGRNAYRLYRGSEAA